MSWSPKELLLFAISALILWSVGACEEGGPLGNESHVPSPVQFSHNTHTVCEPFPECAREPTEEELDEIDAALDLVDQAGCDVMHSRLIDYRYRVYDFDDGDWGELHYVGTDSATVSLWNGTFSISGEVQNTVRHEYDHEDCDCTSEPTADSYMTSCDTGQN